MARVQGELELATPETLIDLAGFDLASEPARLEPGEFSFAEESRTFSLELDGEALTVRPLALSAELALDHAGTWSAADLARWLDRTIEHIHTPHTAFLEWCGRIVADLIERRDLGLDMLLRGKFLLRRAVEAKVRALRVARASACCSPYRTRRWSSPTTPSASIRISIRRRRFILVHIASRATTAHARPR
jgi:hypothetical protein